MAVGSASQANQSGPAGEAPLTVLHLFGQALLQPDTAREGIIQTTRPTARSFVYGPETASLFETASELVYPSNNDTPLQPVMHEGWRTYNFEVEEFHTYIAGGLKVHNTSLLDLVPNDAVTGTTRAVSWDAQGRATEATYELSNGAKETIRGRDLNGDGHTDLVDRITEVPSANQLGTSGKVSSVDHYEGGSTNPIRREVVSIEYGRGVVQGEEIGRTLGSVLGSAIDSNNIFAQVGAATITSTLLQNVGEFLHKNLDFSLLDNQRYNVSPLETAVNNTFNDFDIDLIGNAKIQVNNALSGVLVGEIANALNLTGFERGVFSTVAGTITNQVLANVQAIASIPLPPGTAVNAGLNLLSGFNLGSMLSNVANSLGGFFGSQLGTLAVTPHTPEAALFGSASAAVGSYVGFTLAGGGAVALATAFSVVPIIGTFIGAFLGQALGNFIGNIFSDDDRTAAYRLFTDENGRVEFGDLFRIQNADTTISAGMASYVKNSVNSVLNGYNVHLDLSDTFDPFYIGWRIDHRDRAVVYTEAYRSSGGAVISGPMNNWTAEEMAVKSVEYIVANSELGGEDLILRRAYHVSHTSGLTQLGFDLKVGIDYKKYLENTQLINTLIAEAPGSAFAAGWVATLHRAQEMGLHKFGDFDGLEYLASNRDVFNQFGANREAANKHFIDYGINEGRRDTFDAYDYYAANPGLAQAVEGANRDTSNIDRIKATEHYLYHGYNEGRPTNFNHLQYLASNPGLAQALGEVSNKSAALHYINAGYAEGRRLSFDSIQYLAANPDVVKIIGGMDADSAAEHYITSGYKSGRSASFDHLEYLASNPGLAQQLGGVSAYSAQMHYIQHGYREGRSTQSFDALHYLAANPDLARAYGYNPAKGREHYVLQGYQENRPFVFDHIAYLASNPGFAQALGGTNVTVATTHYVQWTASSNITTNLFNYYRYVSLRDGIDSLKGHWDADTVSFAKSTVGNVVVDMYNRATWDSARGGSLTASTKNAIGSRFNDTLEGDGGDNILDGGAGGADTIRGNGGSDTVSYATSDRRVIVHMGGNLTWDDENNDKLDSIENAIGSRFDDTLDGDGGDNILDGGPGGRDTINGNGGSDTISYATSTRGVIIDMFNHATWDGESGDNFSSIENAIGSRFNDTLHGDSGDNTLDGGAGGADTIRGNGGSDTISYATSVRGVTVAMYHHTTWDGENNDSLDSIENAVGSRFDDTLDGDGGDNILDGGPGGRDTINGNGGSDTISYATSTRGVIVDMFNHATWDGESGDNFSSIENAIGSRFNDTLHGDGGDNILDGGAGGADTIRGNGGSDTISYATSVRGVTVAMYHHTTWDGENNDSLDSIENAIGSRFDDTLDGDGGNNRLEGGGGNDTLYGRSGADQFVFGRNSGRDVIQDFHFEAGDRIDLQGQTYWIGTSDRGFASLNLSGGGNLELNDVLVASMRGDMFV